MEGNSASGKEKKYNNGRRHGSAIKEKARELRKNGLTHREIVKQLGISLGSAYIWTIDIRLTVSQQRDIYKRRSGFSDKKTRTREWTTEERKEASRRLAPYQFKKKHTRESLIKEIQDFEAQKGRVPLKSEFNSRRIFREYFGSWNNAIRAAGLEPNPEFFAKRVKAKDGHMCDSLSEAIVDDWLFSRGIAHSRNKRYPGKSSMTADFYIKDKSLYVEYFGLRGASRKYDRNFQRKMVLVKKLELNLISLFPEDINKLDGKLSVVI